MSVPYTEVRARIIQEARENEIFREQLREDLAKQPHLRGRFRFMASSYLAGMAFSVITTIWSGDGALLLNPITASLISAPALLLLLYYISCRRHYAKLQAIHCDMVFRHARLQRLYTLCEFLDTHADDADGAEAASGDLGDVAGDTHASAA